MVSMVDRLSTPFHDWLVELRRHFHQFPELAYEEEKTAAKISQELDRLGVAFRSRVGQTGIIASLRAQRPGPAVAFRADMDALPLEEGNQVSYRSRHSGKMHACGHDGHVTIALGVIRWLLEADWRHKGCGTVFVIFQPAEERGGGARAILESGLLDGEPVTAIFAGHMHPELPVGSIAISPEVSNAASDSVHIRLSGKGGHAAHPHLCSDPIVAGAYLVTHLQTIVSRNLSPLDSAVLTIGRFQAGTASNIIPQQAELDGTLRTLHPEVRETVVARLKNLVEGLERSFQVSANWQVAAGYPVLVNDPQLVRYCMEQARLLLGANQVKVEAPRMGAEDFAFFLQRWPGVMIRLGCHDPAQGYVHGLHSPHFDFDERALDAGVRLFAGLLTEFIPKRVQERS